MHRPTLILVRGLPGSGKSYLATALQTALGNDLGQEAIVMLDPDTIDLSGQAYTDLAAALTAEGVDNKFYLYRFLRAGAHAGIEGDKIIIWNQPFTNFDGFNKTIINLQAHAAEHSKQLAILIVEVEADPATAKARVLERKAQGGHGPSDATFNRFVNDYVSFADKGNKTVIIQGADDVSVSVSAVMTALDI